MIGDLMIFDAFAKGKKSSHKIQGKNCVIYTRVSGKDQTDNLSLSTQLKGCNGYAEKNGYKILAKFGGTYESAATDERKEFTAMISFVKKSKEKVSFILVYSLERFSRNDNSIWLSGQLRKLGIEIVSVTQPIDTSGPSGQMQQKLLFLFGEFDNQLRKQKCTDGIRDMLLQGDWPTSPPVGFDTVKQGGKRHFVINEKGKLIRSAFYWKANEGLSNEAIRARLAQKGLKLVHQRISAILRNPFYCGLLVHRMLEGRVIVGNHQPIVPREIFLKVNGLLDQNTHGYSIKEENNAIPLKRFMHCGCCGKPMRGYIVKRKNIHYYKCNTGACANNKNAKALNDRFAKILGHFKLDPSSEIVDLIKTQTIATFNQLTRETKDQSKVLEQEYVQIKKKIERLEERFIEEEITAELYHKYSEKFMAEKIEIEKNIMKAAPKVSNLEECVDLAVQFATETPSRWLSADYITQQRIQYLLFPNGIRYDKVKDECRTTRINSVFMYLAYLQQNTSAKKRGIPELCLDYASFASLVAGSRIELPTFGL